MPALNAPRDLTQVKWKLAAAGYNGEKFAFLVPTDLPAINAMSEVAADIFHKVGMNMDYQALDWATVAQRLLSQEPLDKGGWSLFPSVVAVTEYRDLLLTGFMRGNGRDGWFGWPSDPRMEEIFNAWVGSVDPTEQTKLEREYELQGLTSLPFIPLGRFRQTSAWRDNLKGILEGPSVVFRNVTKV